jgi:O-methyltransferase/aklanonic acid methyltransferase
MTVNPNVATAYDSLAPTYERLLVPLFRPIAKRMLQQVDLRPGWNVLDAGTGTGLVALLGAPRVGKTGKMVGVDASEGMLSIARQKAERFGFSQCEFRTGDLNALDFPDATFNACLSQFALHHTILEQSLAEMVRVLAEGGILVIQEWARESSQLQQSVYDVIEQYRSAHPGDWVTALRANSERTHVFRQRFGTPEEMRTAVAAYGMKDVQAFEEGYPMCVASADSFIEIATASPLLHAELTAMTADRRVHFFDDARSALKKLQTANGFEWTYHVVCVVGRK